MGVKMDRVPIIVGPTGVGKTEVALDLAETLGGEIISADSRQIYKLMDIGTAKPTPEQRRRVKHHFIDLLYPDQDYSAGDFGRQARAQIRVLLAQGKIPIVVGGSGLYIRALVDGFSGPRVADREIKEHLRHQAETLGLDSLYRELWRVDLELARRLHPHDRQRILRALEVYRITGKPLSQHWGKASLEPSDFYPLFFGLTRKREELYIRIERRVDHMITQGLVDEVKGLREQGYHRDLNSMHTVGYREIFAYLEGECELEEAIRLVKKNTKHYAKRQLTWFGKDNRIEWLNLGRGTEKVVRFLLERIEKDN